MTAPTLAAARCLSSVYACRMRVTALHDDGTLKPGTQNMAITDALVSIGSSPQVEAGVEITQRNGCGDVCVEAVGDSEIKRYDLALSLCQLDFDLINLMVGGTLLTKGGITVGYQERLIGATHAHVCVEAWSQARTRSSQATVSSGSGLLYFHHVWPNVTWTPGNFTVDNGALVLPLTGIGRENPNSGLGPAADWPGVITAAQAKYLDDLMPAATCGTQNFSVAGSAS